MIAGDAIIEVRSWSAFCKKFSFLAFIEATEGPIGTKGKIRGETIPRHE